MMRMIMKMKMRMMMILAVTTAMDRVMRGEMSHASSTSDPKAVLLKAYCNPVTCECNRGNQEFPTLWVLLWGSAYTVKC